MDEVLSLKPSVAIKRLQAAVRESQGTTRASYAVKNRPEWWKENLNVTLPDDTIAKTGAFVSHSKCAWKPEQVQAALVLFYHHLNGDNFSEPQDPLESNGITPPRSRTKDEQVKLELRPVRTRNRTGRARLRAVHAPHLSSQKFASEPLIRSPRPPDRKKGVTFQDEHEVNVHHTPPRNFQRKKRGPIKITPEPSHESSPSTATSSYRLDKTKELNEANLESDTEQQQSSPSPSPVRRAAPRRLGRKASVKEPPALIHTRSNSIRQNLSGSMKEESVSNKAHHESRLISKKKRKQRVLKTAESGTKLSPEVIVIHSDASPAIGSGSKTESKLSPSVTLPISRRRSSRLSTAEDLTPTQEHGVKRTLDDTLAEVRTPLVTLKNQENKTVTRDSKRRKTPGKKVVVRSTRKSSRKAAGGANLTLDNVVVQKENMHPREDSITEANGADSQLVLRGPQSPRLRSPRRTSQPPGVSHQERLDDASVEDSEENCEALVENAVHEEGVGKGTINEDDKELDEDEDEEAMTEEEKKEHYDAFMTAIARMEKERDKCCAKLEAYRQIKCEALQNEVEQKVNNLNHLCKMRLMRMSEQELSTLVGQMVYELDGDVNNLLVKEMEGVADSILNEGGDGVAPEAGSSSVRMQLEALKTPKARSLRKAVAAATTERKRVNRERCVATRASVRRSTRKAAQTATARTREMLASAARPKNVASIRNNVGTAEQRGDTETEGMSAPVMAAVASEIARLRGMTNSREGLRAFKAQLDNAFGEIV